MNWTSLIGPAVVAAVISGLVSGIGIWLSARTARGIHAEKLVFDREQAQRRAMGEIELAERKMMADVELAQRKFAFDQALSAWRRRYDLAEQVLATAYEARDVLTWARAPVGLSGEGETRKAAEIESDELRERRNSYFVPIERLARDSKTFATLQTLRYAVAAHFGQDAIKPLAAVSEVHHGIRSAAERLIQHAHSEDNYPANLNLIPSAVDPDSPQLDKAVHYQWHTCSRGSRCQGRLV